MIMDRKMMSEIINKRAITVALRGLTILPGGALHFDVSRPMSITAIERAMGEDEKVFLITQKNVNEQKPSIGDLYTYGTYSQIKQIIRLQNGNIRVMAEGISRYKIIDIVRDIGFLVASIDEAEEIIEDVEEGAKEAMLRIVKEQLNQYAHDTPAFAKHSMPFILDNFNLSQVLNRTVSDIPWNYRIKQAYLDASTLSARYEIIIGELIKENEVFRIKADFQKQLNISLNQNQKEYVLKEQLKLIQKELGDTSPDSEEYEEKLAQLNIDEEYKVRLQKEINRLRAMPGGGQESNVIRTYLDTIFDMPWKVYTKDSDDIERAGEILNTDHYGLEKVKERILDYLAVRMLNPSGKAPILCLVGPPGTGKTSIALSVARAMQRKYVRISLGGVRDEAEIRGHRRTYVGAMPGRIADGLRQAKVSNPLMLLDEIDKSSGDYRGDIASAMLEVLDAEQNFKFRDHYIEVPLDLSKVMFLATANTIDTIPRPLLDRMEVIEIHSYTENEKFHIAQNYLVKRQLEDNGLDSEKVIFTDESIKKIIHSYTREAGVRNLERRIGEVCRKCARKCLKKGKKKIKISENNIEKYLGKPRINFEKANETDEIGIARGLAWTAVGGDTLSIEVNIMPGKGKLSLTGQMGDVMKESAQTALSCIRALSDAYNVAGTFYEEHDMHLHIPQGAVPKDGPSAGITMATALLSAVTGRKIRADVAMTGEITLRGRVLPVGGLKEKILAAKMADIKKVIVPFKNKPDIAELNKEITSDLKIVYVKELEEVLKEAFLV